MTPEILSAIISSSVTLIIGVPTFIALLIAIKELRENVKQNQIAIYHRTVEKEHELFRMIAHDPPLMRLCMGNEIQISDDKDKREAQIGIIFLFDFYERIFYENYVGAFPKDLWEKWAEHIVYVINDPEVAVFWDILKTDFFPPFTQFVENKRKNYKDK
jgi:hypothetical protein